MLFVMRHVMQTYSGRKHVLDPLGGLYKPGMERQQPAPHSVSNVRVGAPWPVAARVPKIVRSLLVGLWARAGDKNGDGGEYDDDEWAPPPAPSAAAPPPPLGEGGLGSSLRMAAMTTPRSGST